MIVMCHPFFQNASQLIFRQWDEEVEAFSAERADHAFTEAVCLRASRWCPEYSQSHVRDRSVELGRKDSIVIVDEETVTMVRRDGFPQLLQRPGRCWVGCHITMHNPSGLVFDNDQYVEHAKRCGDDDTEVTGQYGCRMVAKERRPALVSSRLSPRAFGHALSYRTR